MSSKQTWINSFACCIMKTQSHICFRNVSHEAEECQVIFECYSLVKKKRKKRKNNYQRHVSLISIFLSRPYLRIFFKIFLYFPQNFHLLLFMETRVSKKHVCKLPFFNAAILRVIGIKLQSKSQMYTVRYDQE